jgi:cell division protein FtsI/penicillin-binding protein 2
MLKPMQKELKCPGNITCVTDGNTRFTLDYNIHTQSNQVRIDGLKENGSQVTITIPSALEIRQAIKNSADVETAKVALLSLGIDYVTKAIEAFDKEMEKVSKVKKCKTL